MTSEKDQPDPDGCVNGESAKKAGRRSSSDAARQAGRRRFLQIAGAVSLAGLAADAGAPPAFARGASPVSPILGGPLTSLPLARAGRARHEGSWDRKHNNADFRAVAPGETLTLLDTAGAGVIHRFWITMDATPALRLGAILRMYWDGEESPSVEAPIGLFFGVGFGEERQYISLPMNETSGGYNCYWPMPFRRSARWTLTNTTDKPINSFYYNIDFTALDTLPDDLLYFHATHNEENPTTPGINYTVLQAKGRGHYVGTALFMRPASGNGLGFLEGNEMVTIDGEPEPSIIGTGTEDYFCSGWYFNRGEYGAPYHGCVIKEADTGRISAYRWHIEDAIPFKRSIAFTIEHGNRDDTPAIYSSVAYWYQNEPHSAA